MTQIYFEAKNGLKQLGVCKNPEFTLAQNNDTSLPTEAIHRLELPEESGFSCKMTLTEYGRELFETTIYEMPIAE